MEMEFRMQRSRKGHAYIYAVLGLASPLLAQATGLRVPVDNGLGIPGVAGGAALAIDASTGITNPAGLIRIQNPELVVAVNPAFTSTEFTGSSTVESYIGEPFPITQPATRTGSTTGRLNAPLLAIHFSYPLKDFLVYGFSFNNPFGQSANFPENSLINDTVTEATLITWNIANSLGYKINQNWSIGAGFDVQRLDFVAENVFPAARANRTDFFTKNEASDWKYGYHAGILFQANQESTRIGMNYRSQINHDAEGKSYSTVTIAYPFPGIGIPVGGETINRDFTVAFDLPPVYTLSAFQRINKKWDVMATIEFYQWNVFDAIYFTNMVNVEGGDKVVQQDYHNAWTYAAGTYYHFTDNFYLGVGARYDETPMDDKYRGVEFPESNLYVLGFSGGYQFNKVVRLELGYAHSFFSDVHINTTDPDSTVNNVGTGKLNGDVINTQLTINLAPVYGRMEQP
jgi:long-chain fatty acid transport protein